AGTIADNTADMQFTPLACALALNIYGGAPTEKVVSVKFESETASSGRACVDLTADGVGYAATEYTTAVNLGEAARFAPVGEKPEDKRMFENQVYLVIAKADYHTVRLEIKTTSNNADKIYTLTSANGIDCSACDIYAMNINLGKAQVQTTGKNIYPLTFSPGTEGHANTEVSLQDGEYRMLFATGAPHGEHYCLTDPLTRKLEVEAGQKVELVFKYKMQLEGYDFWQFTTYFNTPHYNGSETNNSAMPVSNGADADGWITYRHDLTNAVAATNWGSDASAATIRFRFRMLRDNEVDVPQCPEMYGFNEILIKDAYLQVGGNEAGPVSDNITVKFTPGHATSDFEGRFKPVGMLFGYENDEYYHFQLDESAGHVQHVIYSDIIENALSTADIAGKSVEITFKYKARVDGTATGSGEWYQKWFFKIVPVLDGMTASEYNSTTNALQADGTTTDNLKFGTDAEPMEWTEYRMCMNPSFASQAVIGAWGTDLAKHPQLRLDFRARGTSNNDCPVKSLGLTDVYIKDMKIVVNGN
ncbi:MAG: hypothetical protein K2J33_02585, partial [Alistipes sp.]|nr:hypothetical protein [Alistipes sp.]